MEEIQEHGLLSNQAYERIVGEAPNKYATAMIELTYRASLTRMTFDEMIQQDAQERSARLNQFIGGVLLMNLMDINANDQNPAPYDGNLNPIYRLDQMELNSKNGFKNYAYVPLSRETMDWLREQDTSLNLVIEDAGQAAGEADVISQAEITIGRSVGAKAKNYEIMTPDGDVLKLTEGSRISKVNVIAGKGVNREIDTIDILVDNYGGDALDWQKCKGYGYVDVNGESLKAELHWYQNPEVGKVAFKIKPDSGGELFIYED